MKTIVTAFLYGVVCSVSNPLLAADGKCDLNIDVTGIKNSKGQLCVAIYNGEDGWLDGGKSLVSRKCVPMKAKNLVVVFAGLSHGKYAISLFHDENKNTELETNWIGMPQEGIGISNNAKGSFGPPSYEDAEFVLNKSCSKQSIKLSYL